MNIALILFALPLIAITFLVINNNTLSMYNNLVLPTNISGTGKEKKGYLKGIKPKYQIILKEKRDKKVSLILSIKNLLIIIIAL